MVDNNFPDIKKVCIYGTGGVGGYFGGKIAEAFSQTRYKDHEVYFIARGAHLAAIRQHGLKVKTPDRIYSVQPTLAVDDIREISAVDLILLCVKSYDLNQSVTAIKPVIKDNTCIIPLLNGVDINERIRAILDKGVVLPACLYVGTHIESPGVISQSGGSGIIYLGVDPRNPEYSGETVKTFFQKTDIRYEWFNDPLPPIWEKYMFIAAFGMVTALYHESLGESIANAEHKEVIRGIMTEIHAIAQRKGIDLPADIVEQSINKATNFPFAARTSYQRDIENQSRFNEGDLYGGTIIRVGKAVGIATPVTESVYKQITNKY